MRPYFKIIFFLNRVILHNILQDSKLGVRLIQILYILYKSLDTIQFYPFSQTIVLHSKETFSKSLSYYEALIFKYTNN